MKRILLLSFLSGLAVHLLGQTPYGQYDLNFNVINIFTGANTDGNCPNYFKFHVLLPSGYSDLWDQESGLGKNPASFNKIVTLDNNGQAPVIPTSFYIEYGRSWKTNNCTGPSGNGPTLTMPSSPCTIVNYGSAVMQWNSTVTIEAQPHSMAIYDTYDPGHYLPDNDPIELTATQGYAGSVYDWQYSFDGSTWMDFPAAYQQQSTITFSGGQMAGLSVFDQAMQQGYNSTFIHIKYGCNGETSAPITLTNMYSAPRMVSIVGIPNTCSNLQNASVKIQFSRALFPGEQLNLLVTGSSTGSTTATLAPDNTYTWPQDLAPGTLNFSMIAMYPAGKPEYTDGGTYSLSTTIQSPLALAFTAAKGNDVYCYGGADGRIGINASGGVGNYQLGVKGPGQTGYTWTPFTGANSTGLSSLAIGDYSLRVMDGNGCFDLNGSNVEVVSDITIAQPAAPLALDFSQVTNPLGYGLADGSITAILKGGTPMAGGAYNIDWTDSLGDAVSTVTNTSTGSTYQTVLQNGVNGEYTLLATDAGYALADPGQQAGCMLQQSFTLIQPPPLLVTVVQTQRVTCYGTATAGLVAHAQGGIAVPITNYNYQWYSVTGGTQTAIGTNDSVLSTLPAGDYQVLITDKNSITRLSSLFTITQPAQLAITINTTPLACNSDTNAIATAIVTGGTLPYSYSWSTGDTSAVIGGLTAGGYFIFVSDSNACQAQQTATVTAPTGLVVDSTVTNPSCSGRCDGSVLLNVTGGAGGYTYAWSGASATGASLTSLCTGNYGVTVSDRNGCSVTQHYQLVDPASVAVNAGQNTTLCTGQVYYANATIPDPAAQYVWTGPNGFSSTAAAVSLTDSGMYQVQVTNGTGCSGVDSFTLSRIDRTISADFVVSTQAFAGQPVTLINIASPDPDSIAWQLPPGSGITVISSDSVSLTIQFADTGTYTIGMKSWLAPCWSLNSQQILVLAPQTFSNPGSINDPLVASFTVSPNPSSGTFTALVTLNSTANIRLRLLSTTSGSVYDDRQLGGLSSYTVNYTMGNLAKGSYFLLLETPAGSTIYEIVII